MKSQTAPTRSQAITSTPSPAAPDDPALADTRGTGEYPNEPGVLDDVADKLGFRQRIESNPTLKHAYKIGVGVVGFVVLCAGIVMIPFPGPGWLVVIAGLAILSTEFVWAERLLKFTKKHVFAWMRWVNAQPLWIRLLIGLATALFVYGVIVVALHITGVPGWIPDWVPLWR